MTINTKYNIGDTVRYKGSNNNELLNNTLQGRIVSVGTFDDGHDFYITYTVHQENSMTQEIVFEQQIIGMS